MEQLTKDQLVEIDSICSAYESSFREGTADGIESILSRAEEGLRPALFGYLLELEHELLSERNTPRADTEYIARFPEFRSTIVSFFGEAREAADLKPRSGEEPTRMESRASSETGPPEILRELGRGGAAVVYLARDNKLNRQVALKTLAIHHLDSEQALSRFQQEAEIVAQLKHPHIVPVYESGVTAEQPYLVLEYASLGALDQCVEAESLSEREVASIIMRIAQAVAYAHEQGVIHRDIKPSNILLFEGAANAQQGPALELGLQRSGEATGNARTDVLPKLADFGLAKLVDNDKAHTRTDMLIGSPNYMSPEQASAEPGSVGKASDIYGLGGLLYWLLTGRPPFIGITPVETLLQVRTQEVARPSVISQKPVAADLETICLRCLEKKPEQRYASAQQVVEELSRFLDNKPILARPVSPLERAKRWCQNNSIVAALVAAVFISLVVGISVTSWQWFHTAEINQSLVATQGKLKGQTEAAIQASKEAKLASEQARTFQLQAQEERDLSKIQNAEIALKKAQDLAEERQVNHALAWMLHAMRSLPAPGEDSEKEMRQKRDALAEAIELNIAAWLPFSFQKLASHSGQISLDAPEGSFLYADGKSVYLYSLEAEEKRERLIDLEYKPIRLWMDEEKRYLVSLANPVETAGANFLMRQWDLREKKFVRVLNGVNTYADNTQCLFLENGRVLTRQGTWFRSWDLVHGEELCDPRRLDASSVQVLKGGRFLTDFSNVWEVSTLRLVGKNDQRLAGLEFASSDASRVCLKLPEKETSLDSLQLNHKDRSTSPASFLFLGGRDIQLLGQGARAFEQSDEASYVLDTFSGERLHRLPGIREKVGLQGQTLATDSDLFRVPHRLPSLVATGGYSEPEVGLQPVGATSCTRQKNKVVFSSGNSVFTIDLAMARFVAEPLRQYANVTHLAMSDDGRYVAAASNPFQDALESVIGIWDTESGVTVAGPLNHSNYVSALTFSPDGKELVAGDYHGFVRFWNVESGMPSRPAVQLPEIVWNLRYDESGERLAVGTSHDRSGKSLLQVFDLSRSEALASHSFERGKVELGEFFDEQLVMRVNSEFVLVDAKSGEKLRTWNSKEQVKHWVHNGSVVATAEPNQVTVHDLATNSPMGRPFSLDSPVQKMCLSDDKRFIAIADAENRLTFWHIESGLRVGPPIAVTESVVDLVYNEEQGSYSIPLVSGDVLEWTLPSHATRDLAVLDAKVSALCGYRLSSELRMEKIETQVDANFELRTPVRLPEANARTLQQLSMLEARNKGFFGVSRALWQETHQAASEFEDGMNSLQLLLDAKTWDRAEELWSEILSLVSESSGEANLHEALHQTGLHFALQNQGERARWCYERLLELHPEDWVAKTELCLLVEDKEQSRAYRDEAAEACEDPMFLPWFVDQYFSKRDFEKAAGIYPKLMELDPLGIVHATRYASLLVRKGKLEEYQEFVARTVPKWMEQHEDWKWTSNWRYVWLFCLADSAGQHHEQVMLLAEGVAEDLAESTALKQLANTTKALALLRAGQFEELVSVLKDRPQDASNGFRPYQNLVMSIAHSKQGKFSEARELFEPIEPPQDLKQEFCGEFALLYLEAQALLKDER